MIAEISYQLARISAARCEPLRWLNVGSLPPLVISGVTLDAKQMESFVGVLRSSTLSIRQPLLQLIRVHADRAALDTMLWRLVDQWEAHGCPANGNWTLAALGLLGGDDVVQELARRVTDWRAGGQYGRITLAMEAIAAIGSTHALQTLVNFAAQRRFPAIRNVALGLVEATQSVNKGVVSHQEVVQPSVVRYLDIFDYGKRRFFLILDSESVPTICDEQGRRRAALPKPVRDDDAAMATAEITRWKAAQKTVTQAVETQTLSLEQAMIDELRWHPQHWRLTMLDHPLIGSLARRLIWSGFDFDGLLQTTFCLGDDGSAVNEHYATVNLQQFHAIGLAHPLHMSKESRSRWVDVLQDFHIIPLFAQADRDTYELTIAPEQTQITSFHGVRLKQRSIRQLRERQWKSTGYEHVDDLEIFYTLRLFSGPRITAVMRTIRQTTIGGRVCELPQELFFVSGQRTNYRNTKSPKHIPLNEVSPVIMSEVLLDWNSLVNNPRYRDEA